MFLRIVVRRRPMVVDMVAVTIRLDLNMSYEHHSSLLLFRDEIYAR